MSKDTTATLALLIDGDNASPKNVTGLLAEIANDGIVSVKHIYGGWTGHNLKGWKESCWSTLFNRCSSSLTQQATTQRTAR